MMTIQYTTPQTKVKTQTAIVQTAIRLNGTLNYTIKMKRTIEMNQMDNINKTTQTLPSDVRPASLTHESVQYVSAPNGPLV